MAAKTFDVQQDWESAANTKGGFSDESDLLICMGRVLKRAFFGTCLFGLS